MKVYTQNIIQISRNIALNEDKSIVLRLFLKEATYFDSIRKLGKPFQADTSIKEIFLNVLVRNIGFRVLNSCETECKLYGGTLTLKYSLGDQGVKLLITFLVQC